MSRRNAAPNDTQAAAVYVGWLASLGVAKRIFLGGSRSPLREKKPHDFSDWDFVIESEVEQLKLIKPRESGQLHADVLIVPDVSHLKKIVEIWPNDPYRVFDNVEKSSL